MKIITAANKEFEHLLRISIKNNTLNGHDIILYDLNGTLGYGNTFTIDKYFKKMDGNLKYGKSPYKVDIILDALSYNSDEKCIMWLDVDAFTIKPLDDIENDNTFDLAVTLRTMHEKTISAFNHRDSEWCGYINAGVIFMRPSKKLIKFLIRWQYETAKSQYNSDQHALNNILLQYSTLTRHGEIIDIDGLKIKILNTEEYNWYYWPKDPLLKTKILHFKEHKKNPECLKRWGNWSHNTMSI